VPPDSIQMLVGAHVQNFSSSLLTMKIGSVAFVWAWTNDDHDLAKAASVLGNPALDHVISETMRHRDELKSSQNYGGSPCETALASRAGNLASGLALTHLAGLDVSLNANIGRGALPAAVNATPSTLGIVLNKLKHAIPERRSFRIDSGRHLLVYGGIEIGGQYYYIVEVDVQDIYNALKLLVPVLR
jgi:hypothetical protein